MQYEFEFMNDSFISAPSCDDLKLSDEEVHHLQSLLDWQKRSETSPIILGVPL